MSLSAEQPFPDKWSHVWVYFKPQELPQFWEAPSRGYSLPLHSRQLQLRTEAEDDGNACLLKSWSRSDKRVICSVGLPTCLVSPWIGGVCEPALTSPQHSLHKDPEGHLTFILPFPPSRALQASTRDGLTTSTRREHSSRDQVPLPPCHHKTVFTTTDLDVWARSKSSFDFICPRNLRDQLPRNDTCWL